MMMVTMVMTMTTMVVADAVLFSHTPNLMVLFHPLLDLVVQNPLLVMVVPQVVVVLPVVAALQMAVDLPVVVPLWEVVVLLLQALLLSILTQLHVLLDLLQLPWLDSIGVNIVLIHVTLMLL